MSEIERLRQEAMKVRKAVSNKISRTRRNSGAEIAGSEFDPRRASGIEKRYNARQLQGYINSMKPFLSRSNQFVPDAEMRPIPRNEFNSYKRIEKIQKQVGDAHAESLGKIKTPTGLNIKETQAIIPQSQGSSVYGPYKKFDMDSTNFASREGLNSMREKLEKQLSPGYLSDKLQEGRENLEKVLDALGESDYITGFTDDDGKYQPGLDDLSDFQFDALWYGTKVAEAIFMQYEMEKQRAAGTRKEQWQDRVIESAANELGPVLQWASTEVPRNRTEASEKIKGFRR